MPASISFTDVRMKPLGISTLYITQSLLLASYLKPLRAQVVENSVVSPVCFILLSFQLLTHQTAPVYI